MIKSGNNSNTVLVIKGCNNLDTLLASDVYHCVIVLPSGSGL